MKAFRNLGGNVIEIEVDLDIKGNPILPPDTTVDPRPEPQEGHYVTVVDNAWVQIPIPVQEVSFETLKQEAVTRLNNYRDWYLDQPVEVNGVVFDADAQARNRLVQALVIHNETQYLPPAWIARDNTPFVLTSVADLKAIIVAVQTAFSTRFFEMTDIRNQILATTTKEELALIQIPTRQNNLI